MPMYYILLVFNNYDRICNQKSEEIKQNSNKRNMSLRKSLIKDYGIFLKERK